MGDPMAEQTNSREALADGFWVGEWFVEPMLNRMTRERGATVQVEPKVMDVLLCMARQPRKTVTKDAFMDRVWTDTVVTDDVLSRCISELRKVFRDDARDPEYIETIRKVGYRLIAAVSIPSAGTETQRAASSEDGPVPAGEPAAALRQAPREPDPAGVSNRWTIVAGPGIARHWLLAAAGLVLVVAAIGGLLVVQSPAPPSPAPLTATPFTSFPGQEHDPVLSPNGRQVVFTWDQNDEGYRNLYLMQKVAEKPLRLTTAPADEWSPTWSPDGHSIAFVRRSGDAHSIYVVSSIGGNEREVARFRSRKVQGVTWSPDTSQQVLTISLQQRPHRAYGLYRLVLGSDSLASVTQPPPFTIGDTNPILSPDGRKIAFTRTLVDGVQDVYVVSAKGGEARAITSDSTVISGLDWLPGSEQILFASDRGGTSGLWRVAIEGGSPQWVTTASEGTRLHHPSLDRRGSRLAYAQHASQINIWKVSNPTDYARLTTTRIVSSTQRDSDPSVAPSGERLAFASRRSGDPEIWMTEADGSAPTQLTSFEGPLTHSPQWSPDGEQIAFVSRLHGHADLFVVPVDGGPSKRLTTNSAEDLVPRWSHDGSALYFTSNRTGDWESWRISVQGDSAVQLTEGGGLTAQESTDGRALYFVRPDTTGLWAVSLDEASFPIPVAPSPNDTLPDLLAQNDIAVPPENNLGLSPFAPWHGVQRDVTGPDSTPKPAHIATGLLPTDHANWTMNEHGIHFLRRDAESAVLSFYRFSTQRVDALFLLPEAEPEGGLAASPDGDWFLFTRKERHESDILLVEDFQRRE